MSAWSDSKNFGSKVQFLCICVESVKIAKLFREFTGNAFNALMDKSAPPSFPAQLGCQGFVIVDAEGKFDTVKSASFLELSEGAFRDVENRLNQLNPSSQSSHIPTIFQPSASRSDEIITSNSRLDWLPAVGFADMDADHEKIVEVLNEFVMTPIGEALKAVRTEFWEHSKNEETLLATLGFGEGGALSALKSHSEDHLRIVDLMDNVLKSASISKSDVNNIVRAIYQHAERFDTLYAADSSILAS